MSLLCTCCLRTDKLIQSRVSLLTVMRMSVHWNVNLHPNSQAGGFSRVDNLKATDSITTAASVCVHQQSILCPGARHWAFISPLTFSRCGYECQLNACKLSMRRTNIYIHIICMLNSHLISVFWASYVAVMIGSGECVPFQQDRQPLSSIVMSLMMRTGSDRPLSLILTVSPYRWQSFSLSSVSPSCFFLPLTFHSFLLIQSLVVKNIFIISILTKHLVMMHLATLS